jgi:ADP-ribosylglycohydrolase
VPFHAEQACKQVFYGSVTKDSLMEASKNKNKNAVGSGALARCPMLAVLAASRGMNRATTAGIARTDTQLSHPNFKICDASAAYTILAQLLIESCGDHKGSLKDLRVWIEQELKSRQEGTGTAVAIGGKGGGGKAGKSKEEEYVAPGTSVVAFKEIMSWLSKAFSDKDLPFSEERLESSAQVAFTHAFRHVRLESTFELAMRSTLAGGGDTSRNGAIVGGLVGAAVGLDGIPPRWVKAVLSCNTAQGQQRPPEYHPSHLPELLRQICRGSL